MCGIVGAAARRDIVPVLIEGLRRLEYRGYDSCGVAIRFETDTGTEVIAHLVHSLYGGDLLHAVRGAVKRLRGTLRHCKSVTVE